MSSLKMLAGGVILATLTACSLLEPFIDRRRNAGVQDMRNLYVGRSKPETPAVCYNGLWTDAATIQDLADAECRKQGTGTRAVQTNTSSFTCKIFLPSHAYFKCVK